MRVLNLNDTKEVKEPEKKQKAPLLSGASKLTLWIIACAAIAIPAITLMINKAGDFNPLANVYYWMGLAMVAIIVIANIAEGKITIQPLRKLAKYLLLVAVVALILTGALNIDISESFKGLGKVFIRSDNKTAPVPPVASKGMSIPTPAKVSDVRLLNPLCQEVEPTKIVKTVPFEGRPIEVDFTLKEGEEARIRGIKEGRTSWTFKEYEGDMKSMVVPGLPDWTQADRIQNNRPWRATRDGSLIIKAINGPAKFKVRVEEFT